MYTATYAPDDNKLRLYAASRLDDDTYQRVKAAGFKWAPRQECFVAPKWTPAREDLLLELADEIGDEDTSLVDRAEMRAERFEEYSASRERDAENAQLAAATIADGIPLGQPILVGHHSERHARRDAQKIESNMRKAVSNWRTAEYWQLRAAGAKRHAKYKQLPTVRARRIKTLESERRQWVNSFTPWEKAGRVLQVPWYCPKCGGHSCDTHPEASEKVPHVWTGHHGRGGTWTPESRLPALERHARRWIEHLDLRIGYERAMLDEQGRGDLLEKPQRRTLPPLLNYRAPGGTITTDNRYRRGETSTLQQVDMTRAEYAAIHTDYKACNTVQGNRPGSHRVRVAMVGKPGHRGLCAVFLTDSKAHPIPEATEPDSDPRPKADPVRASIEQRREENAAAGPRLTDKADELHEKRKQAEASAAAGVRVVAADQLFETPPEVAERLVSYADIQPGHRVLEPSAGTGRLIKALGPKPDKVAVEINPALVDRLMSCESGLHIHEGDFLSMNGELGEFDRVVMNPPFRNGEDIKHIRHALAHLKPGGRLVAICANGPRQQAALRDEAEHWEELPAGTFRGTNVRAAIVVLNR